MEPWKDIADAIVDSVRSRAESFWGDNQNARELVEERSVRLAKLTLEYAKASGPDKAALREQMELVAETIETELLAMVLVGQAEAKSLFLEIVGSVFGAVVKMLPSLIALV